MKDTIKILAVIGLILTLIIGIPVLKYKAYKARFPNAPMWTFFFQGK